MNEIEPAELSAYLDGELTADRARAVADKLASDPTLRAEFDALAGADAAWRRTAQTAAFVPSVRWPEPRAAAVAAPAAVALAAVLVALKFVPEFAGSIALGFAAHAFALAVALTGIAWLALSPMRDVTAPPR